ncbi:ClpP/crotonase-like domain-containing protein [Crucibulum laeve]|uniref:ClpP/crotonase-like domain-containing protein n=1 Tax=Crucibulum laeve TaxID=68775 RepID=A0A5C3M5R5_9AGAR|nr:ClpP/crotonase-like domain-containing protein [Crucibulum laeve]
MAFPLSLPTNEPLVTVTHPKSFLWVIELHNGKDNRLTVDLVDGALKPALDAVERNWREQWRTAQEPDDKEGGKGALIIVGRKNQDKFFSNGLDFESVGPNPNFFPLTFNPLLTRLLLFPIPTIAAINGHCYAGGLMLSLACDYRIMTDGSKRNAWLCMNEVHFGAVWPLSFAALLRAKFGDHRVQRRIALEGHRYTPAEALADGILDHLVTGTTADVLAKAEEVANSFCDNARAGVWGLIKSDLYRDTVETMRQDIRITHPIFEDAAAKSRL